MNVKLHDAYGHAAEAIESAASPHGHAHGDALMRHLQARAVERGARGALLDALLGKDPVAGALAEEVATPVIDGHDTGVLALLAETCGGVDQAVALAILPWMDGDLSIEGDYHSGVAWRGGRILVQPASCEGLVLSSAGTITAPLGTPLPETVLTALAGRTVGDLLELPRAPAVATRRIATATNDDGDTVLQLVA